MKEDKELSIEDVKNKVYKQEWKFIEQKILTNCYCHTCNERRGHYEDATIVNYKVFATSNYDLIFKGVCKECGSPLNRLTETSDNESMRTAIIGLLKK